MTKGAMKIAKVNLQNIKAVYSTVGIVVVVLLIQTIIKIIIAAGGGDMSGQAETSIGCYFWLLPLLASIIIPARNFRRIVNLGGKRDNFIWGSLIVYILLAAFASLANTVVYYTVDSMIKASGYFSAELFGGVMNVIEIFGWEKNGVIFVFLQQFAFLLLAAVVIHTLVAMQDKWYGWATDILLAAIISVFVPIAPLRAVLLGFFNLIIFQPAALLQIAACLILAAAIYALNKPIFARKII